MMDLIHEEVLLETRSSFPHTLDEEAVAWGVCLVAHFWVEKLGQGVGVCLVALFGIDAMLLTCMSLRHWYDKTEG